MASKLDVFRRGKVILAISICAMATACSSITTPTSHAEKAPIVEQGILSTRHTEPVQDWYPLVVKEVPVQEVTPSAIEEPLVTATSLEPSVSKTSEYISTRFKLTVSYTSEILRAAEANAYADFPKVKDILAVVAVESGYNAKAIHRGSYGLMQIEKKSHADKIKGRSIFNPSTNIEIGASVLHEYYLLLNKSEKAATLAYNSGIGNYLKGRSKIAYYRKYRKERNALPA